MTVLKGKTMIATCGTKKAKKLGVLLEKHGAQMVTFPFIQVVAATNLPEDSEEIVPKLESADWVVFSSSNGVSFFFEWLRSLKHTVNQHKWKYAVIGKATAETLAQHGLQADFISNGKNADEFGRKLLPILESGPKQILISTGTRSSDTILRILSAHHHCQELVTYQTQTIKYSKQEILELVHNQQNNMILFMSPSAVDGLFASCKGALSQSHLKTVVLGTTTSKALAAHGFTPDFLPSKPNLELLVNELIQYFEKKQPNYNH